MRKGAALAFLLRPPGQHCLASLLGQFFLGEFGRPGLAALLAQRNRVQVLLCHVRILLRTAT